ncbi:integration host factor subunit alpha [Deltaproteobacteria bacterium Smac51]|nr:integration host factor subunit alpha [Deltaproteobacteria bacterium Smac51]
MADEPEHTPTTRREIGERLSRRLGLSARESNLILESFLEAVAGQLEAGGAVTLSGLGRFSVRKTKPRPGRNPATGEAALIPSRLRPAFTLSRSLRKLIKDEEETP